MTPRSLPGPALLLTILLALVPLASAQDDTNGASESDPEPIPYGDESCIECSGPADGPTRGPEGCEYCRGDGDNETPDGGESCMDGSSDACDPDVMYFGGEPTNTGSNDAPEVEGSARTVPAPGVALGILAVGGALLVALASRRQD